MEVVYSLWNFSCYTRCLKTVLGELGLRTPQTQMRMIQSLTA